MHQIVILLTQFVSQLLPGQKVIEWTFCAPERKHLNVNACSTKKIHVLDKKGNGMRMIQCGPFTGYHQHTDWFAH
jgi:hypothetical protein